MAIRTLFGGSLGRSVVDVEIPVSDLHKDLEDWIL